MRNGLTMYKKKPVLCFCILQVLYFQSMSLRYHPCLLCGQDVETSYQNKLARYRPILPKIVLEVAPGEPVDPTPVPPPTNTELKEIQRNVDEAIKEARRLISPVYILKLVDFASADQDPRGR